MKTLISIILTRYKQSIKNSISRYFSASDKTSRSDKKLSCVSCLRGAVPARSLAQARGQRQGRSRKFALKPEIKFSFLHKEQEGKIYSCHNKPFLKRNHLHAEKHLQTSFQKDMTRRFRVIPDRLGMPFELNGAT